MSKRNRRQFALNTLYSVAAIGLGLGLYNRQPGDFFIGCLAYACGYLIARKMDKENKQ